MRRFVTDDKERVAEWVGAHINRPWKWHGFYAMGVEEDDRLIAGVVFDSYAPNMRCSMHCAGEGRRWLSRTFLRMCFDYAFNQMGCRVVVNTVDSDNTDSLQFTTHTGFKEACRIKNGCGDTDLVILTLHREDCRWIGV
jgi:RimJ/RimL family protein N-acetyltransferase